LFENSDFRQNFQRTILSLRRRFPLVLLLGLGFALISWAVYATFSPQYATGVVQQGVYVAAPAGLGLIYCWSVSWKRNAQLSLLACTVSGTIALLLVETSLQQLSPGRGAEIADGHSFKVLDFALQDRASGLAAFPYICGRSLLKAAPSKEVRSPIDAGSEELLPVSGISKNRLYWAPALNNYVSFGLGTAYARALHDRLVETGPRSGFGTAIRSFFSANGGVSELLTDRYGFNNPDEVWEAPKGGDIALGDSFTWGADIAPGLGFVDLIRERRETVVNLGCGGNGPLLNLFPVSTPETD